MVFLTAVYNPALILLSLGVSFISAYVAISLTEQLRQYLIDTRAAESSIKHKRFVILVLISMVLGGAAIFAMHFLGMRAVSLNDHGKNIPIDYNIGLTIISLVGVMIFIFAGVFIASGDVMFSKTKKEIVEAFISDAKSMTIKEIKKISATRLLIIIATKSLWRILLGGITAALGACFMHYIGMLAMQFQGEIVWQPGIVFVSCLIAAVAGSAAFLILFRLLSLFPDLEILRLASATLMAIAVTAMHYCGMGAAKFQYHPSKTQPSLGNSHVDDNTAFYGAVVASNIFLWLMLIFLLSDVRKMMNEKNRHLAEADTLLKKMAEENVNNRFTNNIHSYLSHRSIQSSRENSINSVVSTTSPHHGHVGAPSPHSASHHHHHATSPGHHVATAESSVSPRLMPHNRVVPLVGVESIKEEDREAEIQSVKAAPMLSMPMSVPRLDLSAPPAESSRDANTMTLGFSFSAASGEVKSDENV